MLQPFPFFLRLPGFLATLPRPRVFRLRAHYAGRRAASGPVKMESIPILQAVMGYLH